MRDVIGKVTIVCSITSAEHYPLMRSLMLAAEPLDLSFTVPVYETPLERLEKVEEQVRLLEIENNELRVENERLKLSLPSTPKENQP